MKFWFKDSVNPCSFYFQPVDWNLVVSLFAQETVCTVEFFDGYANSKEYYKTPYTFTPELSELNSQLELGRINEIVVALSMNIYEFKLTIGDVWVEKSIEGGVLFSSKPEVIQGLIDKLHCPRKLLHPKYKNILVSVAEGGLIKKEGEFTNPEDLFIHIYDEFVERVSPGYKAFMEALTSAPLEHP
jgi:hypothetical protein